MNPRLMNSESPPFTGPEHWILAPFWWLEGSTVANADGMRIQLPSLELALLPVLGSPKNEAILADLLASPGRAIRRALSNLQALGIAVPLSTLTRSPPEVEIELTTACNARCVMCPRDVIERNRGVHNMTTETFHSTLEALTGRGVPAYHFCGIGEPLLHPKWHEYAAALRDREPKALLTAATNGYALTDSNISRLAESPIDLITVSIHTVDRGMHRGIVRGFNVVDALDRVDRLIIKLEESAAAQLKVRIGQVLVSSLAKADLSLQKWALERNLDVAAWRAWNRAGHVNEKVLPFSTEHPEVEYSNKSPEVCGRFSDLLFIDHGGEVLACCCDMANQTGGLNVGQHTLEDICEFRWNKLAKGRALYDLCRTCDAPSTNRNYLPTEYFRLLASARH